MMNRRKRRQAACPSRPTDCADNTDWSSGAPAAKPPSMKRRAPGTSQLVKPTRWLAPGALRFIECARYARRAPLQLLSSCAPVVLKSATNLRLICGMSFEAALIIAVIIIGVTLVMTIVVVAGRHQKAKEEEMQRAASARGWRFEKVREGRYHIYRWTGSTDGVAW